MGPTNSQIIFKNRNKLFFHNKSVNYSWKLHGKVNYLIKTGVFYVGNYLRPIRNSRRLIFNIYAVDLIVISEDLRGW